MDLLIADDHKLVAQALSNVLTATGEYSVSTASNYSDVLQGMSQQNYDYVLLDLRMPGMIGLPSVIEVVRKAPDTAIVIFSGDADEQLIKDCIAAGAKGYIPKSMDVNAVHIALQLIKIGQTYIPFNISPANPMKIKPTDTELTERELNVLKLAAQGETNKEIARNLASNETLIKMQMRNICAKLSARNRAHACMIARERLLL